MDTKRPTKIYFHIQKIYPQEKCCIMSGKDNSYFTWSLISDSLFDI
jgi:hypothetical protein